MSFLDATSIPSGICHSYRTIIRDRHVDIAQLLWIIAAGTTLFRQHESVIQFAPDDATVSTRMHEQDLVTVIGILLD